MSRAALASVLALASLLAPQTARGDGTHVIHQTDMDRTAAAQLAAALADATVHEIATTPEDAAELSRLARSFGPDAIAVVLDGRRGDVHVARVADGLVVSRHLGADAFARSPYAVGIVAVELVRLANEAAAQPSASSATGRTAAAAGEPRTREGTTSPIAAADDPPTVLAPMMELGVGAAFGLRGGPSSFGAHLAAGAEWRPSEWLVSAEGLVGLYAEHEVGVAAPAIGDGELRYRRIDVALRASIGRSDPAATIALQGYLGLGLARVELTDRGGNVRGEHDGSHPFIGVGVALRRSIGFGVTIGLSLAVDWATSPARYLVRGAPALEESRIRARSTLAIGWSNYP